MKIISLSSVRIFLTTAMFLLTEPQDLHGHGSGSGAHYENGCTRPHPESRTSATYENALWTNGKSWISASSTKPLRCGRGERDFEFVWRCDCRRRTVWTRCKHSSLLTSCHCVTFEGKTLWLFYGSLKCASCHSCATIRNCISTTLYKNI